MAVSKTLVRKSVMMAARVTGLTALARPLLSGMGAILMLHRIGKAPHACGINRFLSVEARFLDRLLEDMRRSRWRFVTMDEAIDRLKAGHRDERFAAITLDDGYRDNLERALPVFRAHDVPFTVYVCPGLVEQTATLWWDVVAAVIDRQQRITFATENGIGSIECRTTAEKLRAYDQLTSYLVTEVDEDAQRVFADDLGRSYGVDPVAYTRGSIMTWDEIRTIAADPLCTIGAHTINHFHLRRLDRERALFEAEQSARVIAIEIGSQPRHFAYPYGGSIAVGPREPDIIREAGFVSAVTTRHGLLHKGHADHLYALPRISINGEYQRPHFVSTLLSGITVPFANRGRRFVTV